MSRLILCILIVQPLFSCNDHVKSNLKAENSSNITLPSINNLTLSEPQNEHMEALISGTLQVDNIGCLRIEDHIIIWPYGYKLDEKKKAICNSKGKVMAKIGSLVQLSGGERSDFPLDEFSKKVKSKYKVVCIGKYWIVGDEIKMK